MEPSLMERNQASVPIDAPEAPRPVRELPVALDRDVFLRTMIRERAGTLQEVVGLGEASGFVRVVGREIGGRINESRRADLGVPKLDRGRAAAALVDLERRIQGDFLVIEEDEEEIVPGNRACPFAEKAVGRPAMCMSNSGIFGVVTDENPGHAKVVLEPIIAEGSPGRRVVVHLKPTPEAEAAGREFFQV
jgi:hypothetical protein